mgnify:CR=1 FL=1
MKKSESGSGLGKKHFANRVWRGPKRDPTDKYHMFREVCWYALEVIWKALGVAFGAFFAFLGLWTASGAPKTGSKRRLGNKRILSLS